MMPDRESVMQALRDSLKNQHCGFIEGVGNVYAVSEETINDTLELLKEQEAKTGHWIYLQYCANEGVYCSECHTKMFDRYPMKKKLSQFCGHCGAKMEG